MLDAVVALGAVGDVVDLEVYCGALLNGWLYKRATLAVRILGIDLFTLQWHNGIRTLFLITASSHFASLARCCTRCFGANGRARAVTEQ